MSTSGVNLREQVGSIFNVSEGNYNTPLFPECIAECPAVGDLEVTGEGGGPGQCVCVRAFLSACLCVSRCKRMCVHVSV